MDWIDIILVLIDQYKPLLQWAFVILVVVGFLALLFFIFDSGGSDA